MSEGARKASGRPASKVAAAFPFPHTNGSDEQETVKYLRGHSNYLAPQGLTDYLRAFALLSRGIVLNLVLLLPILLILSLLGMAFFLEDLMVPARQDAWAKAQDELEPKKQKPNPESPLAVACSAAGEPVKALTYGHAEGLQVWDLRDLPKRPSPPRPFGLWTDSSPITAAAFSPDRSKIAAAGSDGSLWLFYPDDPNDSGKGLDRASGRLRLEGAPFPLKDFAFSPAPHAAITIHGSPRPGSPVLPTTSVDGVLECEITHSTESADWTYRLRRSPPADSWNPSSFRLPRTAWTLIWLTVLFVGLYPLSVVLGSPLKRLAAGLTSGFRGIVSLLRGLRRHGGKTVARAPGSSRSRGMVASSLIAGSALISPLLFGGSIRWWFEKLPDLAQQRWPILGFAWLGLAWFLCVVFLVPVLRRWRSREAAVSRGDPGPPPRARPIRSALLLLLPWGLLLLASNFIWDGGLGEFFMPNSGFWSTVKSPSLAVNINLVWLVIPLWWISCVVLLKPVLFPTKSLDTQTPESELEWHRRVTGRLYVAANLLLWAYLVLVVYHPVPQSVLKFMVGSYISGFEFGEDTIAMLTTLAFVCYLAMLELLLWKGFARLARGRIVLSAGHDVSAKEPALKPAAAASNISWREHYEKAFSFAFLALAAVAFFEIQPYLVHHYHGLTERYSVEWLYFLAATSFLAIVLAAMFLQAIKGVGQKVALLCLGILGPMLPFLVYLSFVDALVYEARWFKLRWLIFGPIDPMIGVVRVFFPIVTISFTAYLLGKLIDANTTSMHGFYRDRLSQGYLVGVDQDSVLGPEQELSLLDICPEGSGAPYHLINASLNMQGASAGALRWRSSDFFVFSRRWCGGPYTEYCRTEQLEHLAPNVHLGSAMAVSAAAAAPNMGSYTSGFLVILMTLLNVRLGLWLPSPRRLRRMGRLGMIGPVERFADRLQRWWLCLKNRPSGYYLVNEMASRLNASGSYVNLSDGGHLENTGAYELLRRHCRFIVIGDAEADSQMRFGSLATLMRYTRIDLGIEIEIDLGPLRLKKDGTSKGHYAVGKIHYPPPAGGKKKETGLLLYIKTSVLGTESEIIREYRARHADFPQESTADQVFEEDQFEAYRALGFHIGNGLFDTQGGRPFATSGDIESWFTGLEGPSAAVTPAQVPR